MLQTLPKFNEGNGHPICIKIDFYFTKNVGEKNPEIYLHIKKFSTETRSLVSLCPRYCDQTLPGGGWTTIQRRGPKEGHTPLNFSRSWQEYKEGFGDLAEEFWWGNDFIHR